MLVVAGIMLDGIRRNVGVFNPGLLDLPSYCFYGVHTLEGE